MRFSVGWRGRGLPALNAGGRDHRARIWNLVNSCFGGLCQWLDFHHASEHLQSVNRALHPQDESAAWSGAEPLLKQPRTGGGVPILNDLHALLESLNIAIECLGVAEIVLLSFTIALSMPQDSALPLSTSSELSGVSLTAAVIQTVREENHVSIALDLQRTTLAEAGIHPGARLRVSVPGREYDFHYHGTMKAWSMSKQFFGKAAEDARSENPGIEAYIEGHRIAAGKRIEGHTEWLRLRASLSGTKADSPLFSTPEGTVATLRLITPGVFPTKLPAAKLKNGELIAQVLASHSQAMTLNVDAIALRKLKGAPECWYELQIGEERLPIRPRRGINPLIEQEVWNTPDALLFDYEGHWANDRLAVMLLKSMQWNWRGRFPNPESVHIPQAPVGSPVVLRLAPGGDGEQ
ncbi:MAG: hypothetical protein EOP84_27195, partial [Verrucomicrobiaceae bacterium]